MKLQQTQGNPSSDRHLRTRPGGAGDPNIGGSPTEFQQNLENILSGFAGKRVSETELFAAVVEERLGSTIGDFAANGFRRRFEQELNHAGEGRMERAVNKAIKKLRIIGDISREEAHQIRNQAYHLSQLDSNKFRLHGESGDRTATAKISEALEASQEVMDEIDDGDLTPLTQLERRRAANEYRREQRRTRRARRRG